MKSLRLRECLLDGRPRTVIDTPTPLTPWQRAKVRNWATEYYRKRKQGLKGWKLASVERICTELDNDTFLERPIPKEVWEQECLVFGR
jgi:hypothetical protein